MVIGMQNKNPRWSSQVSFQTAHLKRDMNLDHRGFRSAFQSHTHTLRVSFSREMAVHCSVFSYQATRATIPHADTHSRVKRDLRKFKRDLYVYQQNCTTKPHSDTHTHVNRDLRKYQKRPVYMSTETRR